ncbi:hypothetical protein J2Z35_002871 [Acetoanaerobium pronyense]|nr:hypothetical protein [Acetoanaerobium pronyense]
MVEELISPLPPQSGEDFVLYEIEGINVYIDKGFEFTKENTEIDLRGVFFFKELYLTNIKIIEE